MTPTVCVDLDGTLVAGDLLWESFVDLCKRHPLQALRTAWSLRGGRAQFKQCVAREVTLDPATLPYREEIIQHLSRLHQAHTPIVLVTAADEQFARRVADHLGLFTDVLASNGRTNLSGARKTAALIERYGKGNFDYLGNGWSDVPVWQAAAGATVVAAPPRLVRRISAMRPIDERCSRPDTLHLLIKALRPHQWVKNLLVFLPMIAAHVILDPAVWLASVLAFVVFSCCASAIYILNDIFDIAADRLHPRKRLRPFAAGDLSIPLGLATATALLAVGFLTALFGVSWAMTGIALLYVAATTLYSLVVKSKPVADVFALTGLYVLRIIGGSVATATPLTSWFLGFALFFFLSLAFVKRYSEIVAMNRPLAGRGYGPEDRTWIQAIGLCAGYMAVLIMALYINVPEVAVLYTRPQVLGIICPVLLYWLTRLWFRASRGVVHDDPVVEALRDPVSYAAAAIVAVVVFAAI